MESTESSQSSSKMPVPSPSSPQYLVWLRRRRLHRVEWPPPPPLSPQTTSWLDTIPAWEKVWFTMECLFLLVLCLAV